MLDAVYKRACQFFGAVSGLADSPGPLLKLILKVENACPAVGVRLNSFLAAREFSSFSTDRMGQFFCGLMFCHSVKVLNQSLSDFFKLAMKHLGHDVARRKDSCASKKAADLFDAAGIAMRFGSKCTRGSLSLSLALCGSGSQLLSDAFSLKALEPKKRSWEGLNLAFGLATGAAMLFCEWRKGTPHQLLKIAEVAGAAINLICALYAETPSPSADA